MKPTSIQTYLVSFGNLFFPRLCLACKKSPAIKDEITCVRCLYELVIEDNYKYKENEITELFAGRVSIETATSMYTFIKGGRIRNMVHQLKYKNIRKIGVELGRHYGEKLIEAAHFQSIDVIVPVPLHPKKQHQRGYNQSEAFSQGLAEGMQKKHLPKGLKRVSYGKTLTQKSREERFKSIEYAYEVQQPNRLAGKHILLVDDVLTTGATIEACATQLLLLPNTKVSIAVIARGEM